MSGENHRNTRLLKETGDGSRETLLTFNDVSEQTAATRGPTQRRQQRHDENHVSTIAWVKITQTLVFQA